MEMERPVTKIPHVEVDMYSYQNPVIVYHIPTEVY